LFVLCDPGLLLPPNDQDFSRHADFWRILVGWAADRRVSLAPETHQVVIDHFRREGWPNYEPPLCPSGLRGIASAALTRLLSRKQIPASSGRDIPELDPAYVRFDDGALAIALDLSSIWEDAPGALATRTAHWERPEPAVVLTPPPPAAVAFVTRPKERTKDESLQLTRRRLGRRRITIVGGVRDSRIVGVVAERLEVDEARVRWIESEPGSAPQTDRMKGMRAHRDVVCCVLGCPGVLGMGHAGSELAIRHSRDRGVDHCSVTTPAEILDALVALLQS
jgi:hypothetical protein